MEIFKRRRILMLNFEYPPIGGGAATANYHLLDELAGDDEVRVVLVTSSSGPRPEVYRQASNITVIRLNVGKRDPHFWRIMEIFRWSWQAYWVCRRLLRKQEFHLCHCWFGWPAGIIGFLLRGKVPYIVSLRGSDVPGYNERLGALDRLVLPVLSRQVWHRAMAVTANSRELKRLSGKTSEMRNMQVICNGVDIRRFRPGPPHPGRGVRLLFVGRLIRRKGLCYLLEAVRTLVAEKRACTLQIAGGGPEMERLRRFCEVHHLQDHVRFLGNVDRRHIPAIYRQADILVLPSLEESLANVMLEAMASGLPVITTRTGAAELVNGNGFVVPKEDSAALKEAITAYLEDPGLLALHGRQSRHLAKLMSWRAAAKAYLGLYAEHGRPPTAAAAPEMNQGGGIRHAMASR
ncbi:MAG: glycosyltransferase family 4 protein [Desulfobacteraceae bacterium]|nr:glycosyltransferase family 4 protein [Desulfobacteraceae bacterium]